MVAPFVFGFDVAASVASVTLGVLILAAKRQRRVGQPAALGIPYEKEAHA
jgi:hypothetical protein